MTTEIEEWHEANDIESQIENEADLEIDADENLGSESRVSTSTYNGKSKAKELKERISFVRLLERDGIAVTGTGTWMKCLCPFHADNNPSFSVNDETNWARCWSCDWKGDVYAYEMSKRNLGFSDALASLEKKEKYIKRKSLRKGTVKPAASTGEYQLTPDDIQAQQTACKRVVEDTVLCERIAKVRSWNPATIQRLAKDGSLGWYKGALAFIYDTGIKLREWPGRRFEYEFGKPCIWRRRHIAKATDVFLCEGETDAISLLNAGLDDLPHIAVVSVASATSITGDLVELVRGKHVTICMDNDRAGEIALAKIVDMLDPVCASVSKYNFSEEASHE